MTNTNKARLAAASKVAARVGAKVEACERTIRYSTFGNLSRGGTAFVKRGDASDCFAIVLGNGRLVAVVTEYADGWSAAKPADEKAHLSHEFALRSSLFASAPTLSACVKAALELY